MKIINAQGNHNDSNSTV